VAHHGDEHVDEDDDDGDVVEREQEHSDALDDRRGRVAAGEREAGRVLAAVLLRRVLDLDAADRHQPEHRPEQAEQRPRQPASSSGNDASTETRRFTVLPPSESKCILICYSKQPYDM